MQKIFKNFILVTIISLFLTQAAFGATKPILIDTQPVTSGTLLKEYHWLTGDGPAKIFVLELDLTNPYIQVETILGQGKITERSNVSAMAKDTGAVAAINGDFFNMQAEGSPIGPTVVSGDFITSPFNFGNVFALGITQDKQAFIDEFHFLGKVTAPNGNSFELTGLNKTIYTAHDNTHSHKDRLFLYDHMWGGTTRGNDGVTIPTEIFVHNNKVADISQGKYFNTTIPQGSYILRASGVAAEYLINNFSIGDDINIDYTMTPDRDWSMLVGGHSLFVLNGEVIPYAKEKNVLDGLRARSAAGISKDGKTVYLVGVEGRTASSKGLTLDNLSQFFVHIGAWQALNLDGGGSTTMVARPLGETEAQKAFPTEQGWERMVVNAIGVYSTAPKGELKDFILTGNDLLLPGETVNYFAKAFDQYYNPLDISELDLKWHFSDDSLGTLERTTLKAIKPGKATISITNGTITKKLPITIIDTTDIKKLNLTTPMGILDKDKPIKLALSLTTHDDREKSLSFSEVTLDLKNINGTINNEGSLVINELLEGGHIVATYQGHKAILEIEKLLKPWDKVGTGTVTGSNVNIRSGPDTTHPVVTQISRHGSVTITGQEGDWLQIVLANGTTGWIANWLVDYQNLSAMVTGDIVNIRKGPDLNQEVTAQVKKGDKLLVISKNADWLNVILPDKTTGWIANWLVVPGE